MPGNDSPLDELVGFVLVSIDDDPVGVITHVFDDTSAQVRVAQIDLDGRETTLVPLLEHSRQEDEVTVVFDSEQIRRAPLVTEQLDYRTLQQALDAARIHFERTTEPAAPPITPAPETGEPSQKAASAPKFDPPPGPPASEDDDPPWA